MTPAPGPAGHDACGICRALPPSLARPEPAPAPREADEWRAVDRVRGALLGVAIGDALGRLALEGRPAPRWPNPGELRVGGATQLTLFLAEALVHMYARYRARGIGPAWELARMGLQRWAFAQGEDARRAEDVARLPGTGRWPNGWLVREHVLHERVSGFSAVRAGVRSSVDPALAVAGGSREVPRVTGSDGAGGLVRAASAGLLFAPDNAFVVGAVTAAYTHDAPAGYLSAAVFARILAGLVRGDALADAVADAFSVVDARDGGEAIALALRRDAPGAPDEPTAVTALRIGVGTVAAGGERGPVQVIEAARVAGGTAAAVVAGALVGATHGATGIDGAWRVATNASAVLEVVADGVGFVHRVSAMNRPVDAGVPEARHDDDDDPAVALMYRLFPT